MTDQDFLDGNAAAGMLSEVFAADVTTAVGCCGNCGNEAEIARAHVHPVAPTGLVLCCAVCGAMLARISESTAGLGSTCVGSCGCSSRRRVDATPSRLGRIS